MYVCVCVLYFLIIYLLDIIHIVCIIFFLDIGCKYI